MHIGEKVNNQKYLALIILLTPLLVISLSTATFYLGYKPTSSNNNGELVIPQIETQNLNLIDAEGNVFNFSTGKWLSTGTITPPWSLIANSTFSPLSSFVLTFELY